jgi:putative transport protein
MSAEREKIKIVKSENGKSAEKTEKHGELLDEFGFAAFGVAVVLGILLGAVKIPLTGNGFGGACFSLGNTGGPLIVALICGHFGHIGKLNLRVPDAVVKVFREFGLVLFLIGAGVDGGVELVAQVQASEYGAMLVLYGFLGGAVMTIVPMIIGFLFAKYVLKLSLLNNLGSLTGGMTSTPALGTLIGTAGTEDVAAAYASTYPIALIAVVLVSQFLIILL